MQPLSSSILWLVNLRVRIIVYRVQVCGCAGNPCACLGHECGAHHLLRHPACGVQPWTAWCVPRLVRVVQHLSPHLRPPALGPHALRNHQRGQVSCSTRLWDSWVIEMCPLSCIELEWHAQYRVNRYNPLSGRHCFALFLHCQV